MIPARTLALAVLASLSPAIAPGGEDFSSTPAPGTRTTKRCRHVSELWLETMQMWVDEKLKDPSMIGGFEQTVATTYLVDVTDEVLEVRGSEVARFRRSYDSISSDCSISVRNTMIGDEGWSSESTGVSDLNGRSVEFVLDEATGEYDASFPGGGDGEASLLDGLTAELDFRAFLPDGPVDKDDGWYLDPDAVARVLAPMYAPGGQLEIRPLPGSKGARRAPDLVQPSPSEFLGDVEGEIEATYFGPPEAEPGEQLPAPAEDLRVVRLKLAIQSSKDVADVMTSLAETNEFPPGLRVLFDAYRIDLEFTGEGELLWNVARGRVESLIVTGKSTLRFDTTMQVKEYRQTQVLRQVVTLTTADGTEDRFEFRFSEAE